MKHVSVVIFDVDDTLIKGNLTFFFLRRLMRERISLWFRFMGALIRGAIMSLYTLPRLSRRILLYSGNIYKLDRKTCAVIKRFYTRLFKKLKASNLLDERLEAKAKTIFTHHFFDTHMHQQGYDKIKYHLKDSIVVLLSGSPQHLLDVFYAYLCHRLEQDGTTWRGKFFVKGTTLQAHVIPCIGSEKNKALKQLLREHGITDYTIDFMYADNHYMLDLPLLIEAKHGGALISEKHALYECLPKELTQNVIFLPQWSKIT